MSVNCWKYAREVYLIGRSVKFRSFTAKERAAVIAFIAAMIETRPAYVPYINLKFGNPVNGDIIAKLGLQNDVSLGKMVQKIGRSLKVQFCTEEEKNLCDTLFAATNPRNNQGYNNYATDEDNIVLEGGTFEEEEEEGTFDEPSTEEII